MDKKQNNIQEIKHDQSTWINVINPKDEEVEILEKRFGFHPLDLRDAYITKKAQRPQISDRDDYIFLIFLFPIYDKKTREISAAEVDFFIGSDYIITLHDNKLFGLTDLFNSCQSSQYYKENYLSHNPAWLLHQILDRLFYNLFPMLDHIAENNQEIENNIFSGKEREMMKEILMIKRNIVNFRTIMQSHRTIVKRLINFNAPFLSVSKYKGLYEKLLLTTRDIWEILESHKESIDALQETNESAISFRLNDIMKTLTVISVIFLPLTLVASLFGMNNTNMPFVNNPLGFWIIIGLMTVLSVFMLAYFKIKKWL